MNSVKNFFLNAFALFFIPAGFFVFKYPTFRRTSKVFDFEEFIKLSSRNRKILAALYIVVSIVLLLPNSQLLVFLMGGYIFIAFSFAFLLEKFIQHEADSLGPRINIGPQN